MNACCCCLITKLCPTLATPWTVARPAPLSMRFPRQEYWNGLPFPSPGDLPDPGIEPHAGISCMAGGILYHCTTREAQINAQVPIKLIYRNRWHVRCSLLTLGSEDALFIISMVFIIEVVEQQRKCNLRGCPWPQAAYNHYGKISIYTLEVIN